MVIRGHLLFLVTDLPFANILRPLKVDIWASLSTVDKIHQLVSLFLFVYFLQGVVRFHCNIFHDRLQKYNVNFIGDRIANTDRFCDGKTRSSITYLTFSSWSDNHRSIHRSKIKSKPVNFYFIYFKQVMKMIIIVWNKFRNVSLILSHVLGNKRMCWHFLLYV